MENQHLTYFKVENFKRFESLEMNNIGQFNLIVGDNNVGKTSVLEALLVEHKGYRFLDALFYILTKIKKFNKLNSWNSSGFLEYYLYDKAETLDTKLKFELKYNDGQNNFELKRKDNFDSSFNWIVNNNVESTLNVSSQYQGRDDQQFYFINQNIPFIPYGFSYDHNITGYYSNYIQKSSFKKNKFLSGLKKILPLINNIEVNPSSSTEPILLISQDDIDTLLPLATFGDGFLKLFRLLISIIIHSGKRLMIDEIDTGIHYSRMKDFWKILIESSIDNQVQLFATTHSKEALQYYKEALEELGYQDKGRVIRLVEHKQKVVKAYTYTFEQFEQSLDNDNEIR
jgi:AAA15 family ATPase/GTPase